MKILVTGMGGQISSEIKSLKCNDPDWLYASKNDLDISNLKLVLEFFEKNPLDYVINGAAYTNVDKAETDRVNCYKVNEIGVRNLLIACEVNDTKLVHYSTDYVFDGKNSIPYRETDKTNPLGTYAKSKLLAEKLILNSKVKSIIIRTSWVYSWYGNNFVKTILKLSKDKKEIDVVDDQFGSPTSAKDLAKVTTTIIEDKKYKWVIGDIFNFSNEGSCSWYEFAKEIIRLKNLSLKINRISSKIYTQKTKRPNYSLLDKSKIKLNFSISVNHWKISLKNMLKSEII